MSTSITASPWFIEASERRLREISDVITSRAPYSSEYAAKIAEDVDTLRHLTSRLLHRQNAYTSPILRLSPELLCEIFSRVSEQEIAIIATIGWIRVGHVCHHFRSILLGMHKLWARIGCTFPYYIYEEVHARANGFPLTMHLSSTDSYIEMSRNDFAMENLGRARSLFVYECDGGVIWKHDSKSLSNTKFPHLQSIHIHAEYRPDDDVTRLTRSSYELSPINAPQLKVVFLVNVFVPFPPDNVTSLTLGRASESASDPNQDDHLPSPRTFLDLLRRCANVEEISLENMIPELPPTFGGPLHSKDNVVLPKLRKLTLSAAKSRIESLWIRLILPADTIVDMGVDFVDYPTADVRRVDQERCSFLSLFYDHLTREGHSPATAMGIDVDERKSTVRWSFLERLSESKPDIRKALPVFPFDDEDGAYRPSLDVYFYQCAWDDTVSLPRFIDSIPGAYLTHIDNLDVTAISADDLRHLLARLPRLQTISIAGPVVSTLKALSPSNFEVGDLVQVLVPELRHLRLLAVALRSDSCLQEILDVVSSRVDAGSPLHSLGFPKLRWDGFTFTELKSFAERLRQLVVDVEISTTYGYV